MSDLVPRNEHERLEGDWIVCAYCGVRMRNQYGSTAHDHPLLCYEKMGASPKILAEWDEVHGNDAERVNAWDADVYSAIEFTPVLSFHSADTREYAKLMLEPEAQKLMLLWPVSWEQFQAWGGKVGDEMTWTVEGESLCWFSINRQRVAKGHKTADGAYEWTTCTAVLNGASDK